MGEQRCQVSRVVTFLGIPQKPRQGQKTQNGYVSVTYRLYSPDGKPTDQVCETPWIAVALTEFFRPHEVHILATKEAWKARPEGANRRNGEALVSKLELLRVRVKKVEIETGISSKELWDQFAKMKSSLRGVTDGGIVLDITHGLRSQPFFAGAVLTFVSMVDRDRPDIRVVYGAYDLMRTLGLDHAPVLELTPFVELLDWTRDLVLFLESGRLGKLVERTEAIGRLVGRRWVESGKKEPKPRIRQLGEAIEGFARDLQTIRTGALLLGGEENGKRTPSSAKRLLQATREARQDVAEHLPPLADVLDRIEAMARPLVFDGDHLGGADGHEVLAALVDLYLSMGRYVEAITTLREARISAYASPTAARPGLPGFDDGERDYTENVLWPKAEKDKMKSISDIRNDVDHAGYRRGSGKSNSISLINNIRSRASEYRKWKPPQVPHKVRILANITNHPWDEWPEKQRRAALELTGRIVDIDFPRVGPDWSLRRIEDEARKIIQKLPPGTTHALVQGEFTLTMELVRRLQLRGIRCLAATTERRVERQPDGSEVRRFEFVRFRDYPKLA